MNSWLVAALIFISPVIAFSETRMGSLENGFCDETTVKGCDHSQITVSVLDKEQVKSLFKELQTLPHMAKEYQMDGCYARAMRMGKFAESKGIIVAKIFIQGVLRPIPSAPRKPLLDSVYKTDFDPAWGYHVAPVVLVEGKSGIEPMVLDPIAFDRPLSLAEFKQHMLGAGTPAARITDSYFGSRFQYYARNQEPMATSAWRESELEDADRTLRQFENFVQSNDVIFRYQQSHPQPTTRAAEAVQ